MCARLGKLLWIALLATSSMGYAQNLLVNPESIVYDSLRQCYLVSCWGNGTIVRIAEGGEQSYFNQELIGQFSIAGLFIYGDTLLAAAGNAPGAGIAAFSLETAQMLLFIPIPGIALPNDITADSNGILYVTDYWGGKLYKITDRVPSLYMSSGLYYPNGVTYDLREHRLLVISEGGPGGPISGVNLTDSTVSTVVLTGLAGMDGIALDSDFNMYVSEWTGDSVVRFDSTFSNPVAFSSGHNDPADIYFDRVHNLMAVPNFSDNTIDYVPISPAGVASPNLSPSPRDIILMQNYPNPFNSSTVISFQLPVAAEVKLVIFDINGRQQEKLLQGWKEAGSYDVRFESRNLTSGLYCYRLEAGSYAASGKMAVLK